MTKSSKLVRIDTGYACGGIVLDSRKLVEHTAPIFQWMRNKHISEIVRWIEKKGYSWEYV